MRVLAIDTSGLVASVALVEDDVLRAEFTTNDKKTHSQTLLPMLEQLRQMISLELDTIDVIAIAAGPGSFTGLRIGSATAKGLGLALGKPLVEVPTLEGLAYNLYGTDKLVCPMMDARRNQVYTGLYEYIPALPGQTSVARAEVSYELRVLRDQCAVDVAEIVEECNRLGREVIFLGDGVPVFSNRLKELMKLPYGFAPAHMNRQRAAAFAPLAMQYLKEGKGIAARDHAPEYLRPSQAEREKRTRIREMEAADVEAASRLESEAFSMPWSSRDFLEMVEADYANYYVAELNGKIVGCCGIRNIAGEGEITNVVVDAAYRNQGIGKQMMRHMLKKAAGRNITVCTLEVRLSNTPAIRLYESLGFKGEGVRPGFYERPVEDALIMWKR